MEVAVKRSISLVGAVLGLLPLGLGLATATAGGKPAASVTKVVCKTSLDITVAAGATSVTPPVQKVEGFARPPATRRSGRAFKPKASPATPAVTRSGSTPWTSSLGPFTVP